MAAVFIRKRRILVKIGRHIKSESAASIASIGYSAEVFPIPFLARSCAAVGIIVCSACVSSAPGPKPEATEAFYTVTAEIALSRHEVRTAALQYAAAAAAYKDVDLLRRAADVTAQCLQPSLTVGVADRWLSVDPTALDAHRAAARAALELHRIEQSAAQYRVVLSVSPRGTDAEFAALEAELASADNVYGARQVADRLAQYFPASQPAMRMQAFAALRADDPASAVRTFNAALAVPGEARSAAPGETSSAVPGEARSAVPGETSSAVPGEARSATPGEASSAAPGEARSAAPGEARSAAPGEASSAAPGEASSAPLGTALGRREMIQGLWRARILAGDAAPPLAEAKALLDREDTAENRLDYALLLLAAQRNAAAREQLAELTQAPDSKPVALRLLGLLDFQEGKLADASARFAELVTTGKFLDDGFYYLALIAERHDDLERALRLYAQVQNGDNAVPALLRAATILRAHGAAPAAEELLDQLVNDEPQRAPEILAARAHIYSDAGDLPRAITVLEQAELQYPDSVELRYALASTSEEQGNVAAALKVLKEVAALRPTDPAAINAYGYTLADHKRHLKAARKLIEQAYAAAPKNAAILDSLGWVLFRQGHDAEALPYLDAAYADEHDGDIAAHLGEVLWRLGRREDADRVWSAASLTESDNHLLKATQQRLHASN